MSPLLATLATGCATASDDPTSTLSVVTTERRILVAEYNPMVETREGGMRVVQHLRARFGWTSPDHDPRVLADRIARALEAESHGRVRFSLLPGVEQIRIRRFEDGSPYYQPETLYSIIRYDNLARSNPAMCPGGRDVGCYQERDRLRHACSGSGCNDKVDYQSMSDDNNWASRVARGEFDEVWAFGPPWGGWYESRMLGDNAYHCNSPPETRVHGRRFVVMGYAYHVGLANALESFAHRSEDILSHVYNGRKYEWTDPCWALSGAGLTSTRGLNLFQLFMLTNRDLSSSLQTSPGAGIGCAHSAFNAVPGMDYDRRQTRRVYTTAAAWRTVPFVHPTSVPPTALNDDEWRSGCSADLGECYLRWWFRMMPYGQAVVRGERTSAGPNWWRHIVGLEDGPPSEDPPAARCGDGYCHPLEMDSCARDCSSTTVDASTMMDASVPPPMDSGTGSGCSTSASGTSSVWTCTSDLRARQRCISNSVQTESCPNGCVQQPTGVDDYCASAPPPMDSGTGSGCSTSASGTSSIWTCTSDLRARQRCISNSVQTESCPNGCVRQPTGVDDYCASAPPPDSGSGVSWDCARSAYGGAQYWTCSGGARYRCSGGVPQREMCEVDCFARALGQDDLCVTRDPSWACTSSAYGGGQYWTCSGGALHKCIGSQPVRVSCPAGCASRPLGTDDVCN